MGADMVSVASTYGIPCPTALSGDPSAGAEPKPVPGWQTCFGSRTSRFHTVEYVKQEWQAAGAWVDLAKQVGSSIIVGCVCAFPPFFAGVAMIGCNATENGS